MQTGVSAAWRPLRPPARCARSRCRSKTGTSAERLTAARPPMLRGSSERGDACEIRRKEPSQMSIWLSPTGREKTGLRRTRRRDVFSKAANGAPNGERTKMDLLCNNYGTFWRESRAEQQSHYCCCRLLPSLPLPKCLDNPSDLCCACSALMHN